ncbi:hypothetical protein ACQPZG_11470 [Streptomyces sp. CA-294286]|uniref:hypothetical protein n=1 Tax=Streptomyces sp. CA-294286 TaxID=3240070 RepID=UPI003D8EF95A
MSTLTPEQESTGLPATRPRPPLPRASSAPSAFRTELRRGLAPWAGLAVLAVLGTAMGSNHHRWLGGWDTLQDEFHVAAGLLGGPLAVALGCWQGGRERRRGTVELLASTARAPIGRAVPPLAALVLWVLAGYAATFAGALVATWFVATAPGTPHAGLALAEACFLASATTLGFVAGRVAPWRLTAPVLAACSYVALSFPVYLDSELRHLSPASDVDLGYEHPAWWYGPLVALWTGGAAVAVLLLHLSAELPTGRRTVAVLLPTAVAVAALAVLVQSSGSIFRPDPAAARRVCDDSRPRVCIPALDSRLLPEVTRAMSGLTERLAGVENLPAGPVEPMLRPYGHHVVRGSLTDPRGLAWEAAAGLLRRECAWRYDVAGNPEASRAHEVDEAVHAWLTPLDFQRVEAPRRPVLVSRIEAMEPERRRAWLSSYFATHTSCDPKDVPSL